MKILYPARKVIALLLEILWDGLYFAGIEPNKSAEPKFFFKIIITITEENSMRRTLVAN